MVPGIAVGIAFSTGPENCVDHEAAQVYGAPSSMLNKASAFLTDAAAGLSLLLQTLPAPWEWGVRPLEGAGEVHRAPGDLLLKPLSSLLRR